MKIGLYGGSFDPIHNGHIRPVLKAKDELGLDRVFYVPTARPPHKPGRQFAVSRARLVMVEMALLDYPELEVARYELTPGRVAYTIDTVEYFQRIHPSADLYLIVGVDSLARLNTWKRWQDLVEAAELGVLVRPGWNLDTVRAELPRPLSDLVETGRVHFIHNQPVEISSTQLREIFAEGGDPPPGSTHPLVVQYIRKYSLYR